MRSLSNVIKAGMAPVRPLFGEQREKVVIDSNKRAEQYLMALSKGRQGHSKEGFTEGFPMELPEVEEDYMTPESQAALQEQAARILSEGMDEARRIKEQALREAAAQKNAIFEEARQQGYEAGLADGQEAIRQKQKELQAGLEKNRREYEKLVDGLEPQFSELVIRYVQKLTGIVLEENRPVVGYLIREAVKNAEPSRHYIIHVSPGEFGEVKNLEQELEGAVGSHSEFELIADKAVAEGECKIETDTCVIDTGVGTKLRALVDNIRLLSEGR